MGFHFSLGDNFAVGCQRLIPLVLNISYNNYRIIILFFYHVQIDEENKQLVFIIWPFLISETETKTFL